MSEAPSPIVARGIIAIQAAPCERALRIALAVEESDFTSVGAATSADAETSSHGGQVAITTGGSADRSIDAEKEHRRRGNRYRWRCKTGPFAGSGVYSKSIAPRVDLVEGFGSTKPEAGRVDLRESEYTEPEYAK